MVKYKRVKHYHEPGDVHELTFSCYDHMPLLTNDTWRGHLAESIDTACRQHAFRLVAFVFMPEHVHLLTLPEGPEPDLGHFIAAVKRPVSAKVKSYLAVSNSRLLERLTVRERAGKSAFRYWQEGPGYDRNLQRDESVLFERLALEIMQAGLSWELVLKRREGMRLNQDRPDRLRIFVLIG